MNRGLRLEVLNRTPINARTKKIEVLVKGDDPELPLAELEIASLRFGTHSEVNYGRGAKALKAEPRGNDLLVTFQGKGSGITDEEFAPKLIGRYKSGRLAFGYARLPYVNYTPAILSARRPVTVEGKSSVEVQNFGLSASKPCRISVWMNGQPLASAEIGVLQPYEKVTCRLPVVLPDGKENDVVEVVFEQEGKPSERNRFVLGPAQKRK